MSTHFTSFLRVVMAVALVLMVITPTKVLADTSEDLMDMSLDDLLNMQVSSVSKKAERLQDVPSSMYVLTSEDIENSGATSLHEALMLVPGYWGVQNEYSDVAPVIRNSPSASGSRGTVLYLLDGTPILDIMSSTLTFENFDIPLDEIDRIEVIRGSGGTVYGANSATGVVNILTKSPESHDGFSFRADGASPTFTNLTAKVGGQVSEKLTASVYGKVRHFDGYGALPEFDGETVTVHDEATGSDMTITNRFTADFEKSTMYSGGLKATYQLNDNSKFSTGGHFNSGSKITYTNYETDMALIGGPDVLVENDITRSRFVGNMRLDHKFNDQHSLFARVSTNRENDVVVMLGGYKVNNSIIDLEVQDNISLGSSNDLSVGVNYRNFRFDIREIAAVDAVRYIEPKSSKNLSGAFVQDKVKLLEGKLNFTFGIKAENYELIDKKYYLSPMAKFTVIPTENFTTWGGFTQSYTTPGYNNTNIDLLLMQTLNDETVFGMATQGVWDGVYQATYEGSIIAGADEETAVATATAAANGFIASPDGQAAIAAAASGIRAGLPDDIGVTNGNRTVPTKFQTWELGFRANIDKKYSFETNFFYSNVTDAIAPSAGAVLNDAESKVVDGEYADYYLYGNYVKGSIFGTESMVRFLPWNGTKLELAHTYSKSKWEYQENDDFDIHDPSVVAPEAIDLTPETPIMPEHLWKARGFFQLPNDISLSVGLIYASQFSSEGNYDYPNQRYSSILSPTGTDVATKKERTFVNFRVEKELMNNSLALYVFGNDIFNKGIVASASTLGRTTLSQIKSKFGAGLSLKL